MCPAVAQPIVALESTLITHGFAYPRNFQVAQEIEQAVRDAGAQPATIAVLNGQVKIGLSDDELEALAKSRNARKCSVRDLGIVIGLGLDGSTTVAATMFLAARHGIGVFATGGIGGVHRGHPFDVSADLIELSRTPVTVVCAGAKALLDLPLTFEHLETLGVPVIGYQTDEIPAFYSRRSGLRADICAETPQDVARIVRARRALGLPGGELVCAPVPREAELPREVAEEAIIEAQRRADAAGIHGPAATPFMLDQIAKLTGGASVRANVALLINNARIAAHIARAMIDE
ncbi:MAG: pseudouridine-5-phosphate glycosidase [Candidatus Thermofonsia Clade 3 bacterium]|uniref:Pseudouridine-5'-phosphate glycosidase n=1 Tax=Candidatus Thermofonsia Clade 3 bacterium TaxID=2364212 RepID=A0A2M8QGG3_9CHLR|nr:MAG: pseudouridine-5-phosphate glycosidase [Candidatus Thermofonsia Clade 3 bacterium]